MKSITTYGAEHGNLQKETKTDYFVEINVLGRRCRVSRLQRIKNEYKGKISLQQTIMENIEQN